MHRPRLSRAEMPTQSRVCVFSPAPLLTVTIESLQSGNARIHIHAGGQGFWVARLVVRLEAEAILCAALGRELGVVIRTLAEQEGVAVHAVAIAGDNAAYVHDRRSGVRDVVATAAQPALDRHELDELYTLTVGDAIECGVCVLAGSPATDVVPVDVYRRLASDLRENGVAVLADLHGEQLAASLAGGLALLKVSHEELMRDGLARSGERDDVVDAIDRLREAGTRNVVVSRAEQPGLAWMDGTLYEIEAPRMEVIDHRGAGDSMTAALAVALARNLAGPDALRLAAAAGSLNVTRHGLGTGDRKTIEQLSANVVVRPLR